MGTTRKQTQYLIVVLTIGILLLIDIMSRYNGDLNCKILVVKNTEPSISSKQYNIGEENTRKTLGSTTNKTVETINKTFIATNKYKRKEESIGKILTTTVSKMLIKTEKQTIEEENTNNNFTKTINKKANANNTDANKPQLIGNSCGYNAQENHTKFMLSYSLFGNNSWELFGQHVESAAKETLNSSFYNTWGVRIYHDNYPLDKQKELKQKYKNLYFCDVRELKLPFFSQTDIVNINGRVWRFIVLSDPTIDIACSRDLDSPLLEREEAAVKYWLSTGKTFHVMRDNFWHDIPLLAGMWCYKLSNNRKLAIDILKQLLENAERRTCNGEACHKQDDQTILMKYMWPVLKSQSIQHDSFLCKKFDGSIPFTTKRKNPGYFVGCVRPCDGNIGRECPVECRPKEHQDWKLC